jgi:large subunit ribosomal protein L32
LPLPKRRHSQTRRDKRRTNWKLETPNVADCPRCHAPRLPHHACPSCGFYNGRLVVEIKEKEAKSE